MPMFRLPLSGAVSQNIHPWTALFSPFQNQYGLINISLGRSSAPQIEQEVLDDVGSYGRQLGRIGDALTVLLDHFHPDVPLTTAETAALDALREMLAQIDEVKQRNGRQTPLRASCACD